MFNPLPIVAADLKRSRSGVLAIVLLIAVAVALGVAVSAQERALREGSAQAADAFDLVIGAPGSATQLVLSTVYLQPATVNLIDGAILQDLAENDSVGYAAPIGFGDSYRGYQLVGTSADFITRGGALALAEGTLFDAMNDVVIGADVDLAVGEHFEPVHGQVVIDDDEHGHDGVDLHVVGRMARQGNPWDRAIVGPIEMVWWVHGLPTGHTANDAPTGDGVHFEDFVIGPPWDREFLPGVPAIVVKPSSFSAAYALRQAYRADTTMAVFPAEVLITLYGLLGDVRDLLAVISILTQVLVIGAVLLAVLATLAQRRRAIGVLRALGASKAYVFTTVWLHVSLMITTGAVLGLLFGWGGAAVLSRVFASETGVALPVSLSGQEFTLVGVLVLIGLALAAIPSLLVYRKPVSVALRS